MPQFLVRASLVVSLSTVLPGCFLAPAVGGPSLEDLGDFRWGPNLICPAEPAQFSWDMVNDGDCGTCEPEVVLTPAPTPPAAQEFTGSAIWTQTATLNEYVFEGNACLAGDCVAVTTDHTVEVLGMTREAREVNLAGRCGPSWIGRDLETEWSRDCVRMAQICNRSPFPVSLRASRSGLLSDPVELAAFDGCTDELGEEPALIIGTVPSLLVDRDYDCVNDVEEPTANEPTVGGEETPEIRLSIIAVCSARCEGP